MPKTIGTRFRRRLADSIIPQIEILEDRRLLSTSGTVMGPPVSPPQPAPPTPAVTASTLVTGPDGNIWFTDQDNNAIGRETPDGAVTEFPLPADQAGPDRVVSRPHGHF